MEIDPRDFIRNPYTECPNCGKIEFGVLMINGSGYVKRCRECWETKAYSLPKLNKKVIYLDQFVVSNMMKSINTSIASKDANDDYFRTIFKKLDYLSKAQIIVCPDSDIHYKESVVARNYDEIKQMYKLLSSGLGFMHTVELNRGHLFRAFKKWLGADVTIMKDSETVIRGLNNWNDRIILEVSFETQEIDIQAIRQDKKEKDIIFNRLHSEWKDLKDKDFDFFYQNELYAIGRAYIQFYIEFIEENAKLQQGLENNIEKYIGTDIVTTMFEFCEMLDFKTSDLGEKLNMIGNFFNSDIMMEIPNHRISSLMFAAKARRIVAGQKKFGSSSFANDVKVISSYLPYSDAMFIDKECHRLLQENPIPDEIGFETKLFSLANRDEFIKYLDELINEIPVAHMALIKQVYGESWPAPYITMYEN